MSPMDGWSDKMNTKTCECAVCNQEMPKDGVLVHISATLEKEGINAGTYFRLCTNCAEKHLLEEFADHFWFKDLQSIVVDRWRDQNEE